MNGLLKAILITQTALLLLVGGFGGWYVLSDHVQEPVEVEISDDGDEMWDDSDEFWGE